MLRHFPAIRSSIEILMDESVKSSPRSGNTIGSQGQTETPDEDLACTTPSMRRCVSTLHNATPAWRWCRGRGKRRPGALGNGPRDYSLRRQAGAVPICVRWWVETPCATPAGQGRAGRSVLPRRSGACPQSSAQRAAALSAVCQCHLRWRRARRMVVGSSPAALNALSHNPK